MSLASLSREKLPLGYLASQDISITSHWPFNLRNTANTHHPTSSPIYRYISGIQIPRQFSSSTNTMSSQSNIAKNVDDLKAPNLFNVDGFVAVVTGGGTGIGLMITQALVANGATVYILGRRKEALEAAAKHHGQGGHIIPVECDVTSKSSIQSAVSAVSSREKLIHLLVNNSGIAGPKSKSEASDTESFGEDLFTSSEFSEWDDTYRVNVTAAYFTTFAFLPLLKKGTESEKGFSASVINTTSISGLTKNNQNHFCYNTSKAGAIHLTRLLAQTLTEHRIRVNSIAPGIFPSEMTTDKNASDEKNQSTLEGIDSVPAKRAGNVIDMARVALFLGSRGSEYMNGQTIVVDGGYLLSNPSAA